MMPSQTRRTIQVFPNGGQPQVDLLDRAHRFGDGLFETVLLHQGRPLGWPLHFGRLLHGAEVLGYAGAGQGWDALLLSAIAALDPEGRQPWARLRLQVWRQSEGAYAPLTDAVAGQAEWQALPGDPWTRAAPQRVLLCEDAVVVQTPLSIFKTCSALAYVRAARIAQRAGYDEAILFNAMDGGIAEASASNFFMVKGNELFTPPLSSGCLPGTVRSCTLAVAPDAQLQLCEKRIDAADLAGADEIFLTNSIRGLVPVGAVEGTGFVPQGSGKTDELRRLVRLAMAMPACAEGEIGQGREGCL
jgi:branched-chain amino acid aminotransferase